MLRPFSNPPQQLARGAYCGGGSERLAKIGWEVGIRHQSRREPGDAGRRTDQTND